MLRGHLTTFNGIIGNTKNILPVSHYQTVATRRNRLEFEAAFFISKCSSNQTVILFCEQSQTSWE